MKRIPSKEEIDAEKKEFTLVPADDYLVKIESVEEKEQPKYKNPNEKETVLNVRFKIIETRDGEKAKDDNGDDATDRLLFFTANIESVGWQTDGTPSKARQLVCYAMDTDIESAVELESEQDLVGRKIYAQVVKKNNTKGELVNRIVRFSKVKGDKKEREIPVIDDDDLSVSEIPF